VTDIQHSSVSIDGDQPLEALVDTTKHCRRAWHPPRGKRRGFPTAVGIFTGLRHDLFSRCESTILRIEQVYRWLCHTAVTPILAV